MRRSKKWALVIGLLLLLPLPVYIIWDTHKLWQSYLNWKLVDPSLNQYAEWYLVIIGVILAVILIFSILIILFWPTRNKFALIHKKAGHVKLTSKAINGFVSASLAENVPYLNNPKVTSKLTNRRLKLEISGDLGDSENIKKQLESYLDQLKTDLQKLLGITKKPKITIRFSNFQPKSESSSHSRVE